MRGSKFGFWCVYYGPLFHHVHPILLQTGDNQETATEIAKSSRLITPDMVHLVLHLPPALDGSSPPENAVRAKFDALEEQLFHTDILVGRSLWSNLVCSEAQQGLLLTYPVYKTS
jgi:hypothetical protein